MAFEQIETSKVPISTLVANEITTVSKTVLSKLNNQLYALMMVKMGGRAETLMKSMDHRCGLEAWRIVWNEIGRKDEQSMHTEFIKCTEPGQSKNISELSMGIIK